MNEITWRLGSCQLKLLGLGQGSQLVQSHEYSNADSDYGRLGTLLSRVCLPVHMNSALPMITGSCNAVMTEHPPSLKSTICAA